MPQIEVVLSPALFHLHEPKNKNVVVIDVLRATSAIVTALANGVEAIIPVADLDEAREMKEFGYIIAGERNGEKVNGFDLGNSPFDFQDKKFSGVEIVLTTTNGTRCIEMCRQAQCVIAGAFLNIQAVADYLIQSNKDTLLFCAGWKEKFNLEDTLYAGALAELLAPYFHSECDSTLAARTLYNQNSKDLDAFLEQASHVQRFKQLNIVEDKTFCLTHNLYQVVPVLSGKRMVANDTLNDVEAIETKSQLTS